MYPFQETIKINQTGQAIYLQVANAIINEIHEGRLTPGQKLPGARILGESLRLNRKTIVAAMEELAAQGWVESFAKRGTFVSRKLPAVIYKPLQNATLANVRKTKVARVNRLPFLEALTLDSRGKVQIDDGIPDVRLSPIDALLKYQRSLLSKKAFNTLLKYGHVEGDLDLRTTLKTYLSDTRCIVTNVGNIFITRGSQMGLYLIIASLVKNGDVCITSFPGYKVVDDTIHHLGGNVAHVDVDHEGIIMKEVEALCKRQNIRLLYITPHHHYPTTVTLSPVRRIELLQLAIKYDFFILEDDYAYDFHYSNNPVLPLASLNKSDHVIYTGSFSKSLAPSVRIGYFVAPAEVIEAANKLRRVIDRLGDPPLERSLSEFIKSGDLQRHLKKVVKIYRHRRDYFCELLQTYLSDHVTFVKPEGGMSVWVVFKKRGILKMLPARLAKEGYLIESDNVFNKKLNAVRIGFASLNEREMERFVAALTKVVRKNLPG